MPTFDVGALMTGSSTASAVGPVASSVRRSIVDATKAEHSIESRRLAEMTVALLEACTQAQQDGWDGYGGQSVKTAAYILAEVLMRLLPPNVPAPEISVHPDGQIAFDWVADREHVFSISTGDNAIVFYAGLFGRSKVAGRETIGGTFPTSILPHISRVADLM